MSKLPLLLILTLILMQGCQSTPERIDTACSWVKPISTTAGERKTMTRQTKEQIAALNDLWDAKCGAK